MRALWRLISLVKPYTHRYDWPVKDRPNATSKIPYAYMEDPENPLKLIPDPELIPHIERALQYINDYRACKTRGFGLMISNTFTMHSNQQGADHCVELFLAFCLTPNAKGVVHNTMKGCRRFVLKSGYMGGNFYEELKLYSTYAMYEQLLQHFII